MKTGFAVLRPVLGLVLISFGLLGCEQAPPKLSAETRAAEKALADDITSRSELITPGMTRDEVEKILGPVHRTIGKSPTTYSCDEFRYVNDVGSWYVLVWFSDDVVDDVVGAVRSECYLEIV